MSATPAIIKTPKGNGEAAPQKLSAKKLKKRPHSLPREDQDIETKRSRKDSVPQGEEDRMEEDVVEDPETPTKARAESKGLFRTKQ